MSLEQKIVNYEQFDKKILEHSLMHAKKYSKKNQDLTIEYFYEALNEFYNCKTIKDYNTYRKIIIKLIRTLPLNFENKKHLFEMYNQTIKDIQEKPIYLE